MLYKVGDFVVNSMNNEIYEVISADLYLGVYTFVQKSDGKLVQLYKNAEHWLDHIRPINTVTIWEELNATEIS